jgi:hypothetical protein
MAVPRQALRAPTMALAAAAEEPPCRGPNVKFLDYGTSLHTGMPTDTYSD